MRVRLFTLLLVPAAAALILAALVVLERSGEHGAAKSALTVAELADGVEPLDKALGTEALRASQLVQPDASLPRELRLLNFRRAGAETDRSLARVAELLQDGSYHPDVAATVEVIGETLAFRSDVEDGFVSPLQILDRYSYLRKLLLKGLSDQTLGLTTAQSQQQILALVDLIEARSAHLDERVGVELAQRYSEWAPGLQAAVVVSVARQESHLENANRAVSDSVAPSPGPTLNAWRERILTSSDAPAITLQAWQSLSDSWIYQLDEDITDQRQRARDELVAQESRAETIRWLTLLGVIGSLSIAMFIASVVSVRLVRRVGIITKQARRMAAGAPALKTSPEVRGSDELGQLATAFDEMIVQIDTRIRNQWIESGVLESIVQGKPIDEIMAETALLLGADDEGNPLYQFSCDHNGPMLEPSPYNADAAVPLLPESKTALGLVAMAFRRDADHSQLERQANRDELTGLLNRGAVLNRAMDLSTPSGPVTVSRPRPGLLYIDLDDFKSINDQFGHAAGDRVLVVQAERMSRAVAPFNGVVGRLGGDEFLVIVPAIAGEPSLAALAQDLVVELSRPIPAPSGSYQVGASIGCAMTRPNVPPLKLLTDADAALYEAKKQGRSKSLLSTRELRDKAVEVEELRRAVPEGIEQGQFVPWYQPIWSDDGKTLVGMEALARWHHPERGLVAPGVFIPVAEELHLLAKLDRVIFEAVCRQVVAWERSGLDLGMVHYNLSTAWLEERDFVDQTRRILDSTGCRPEVIVAEVTESGLMTDISSNAHRLQGLREIGIRIAVDDFGQGYSSLAYLSDLPVDLLKIDRRFVDRIDEERSNQAIVSAVLNLGQSLGLRIVAEGVERLEELEYLAAAGCHLFQGYLLAKPAPGEESTVLLARSRGRRSELAERLSYGSIDEVPADLDLATVEAEPT